jgi:hypothetical protein
VKSFQFGEETSIRELPDVFRDDKRADFVLPATKALKGMIIELKYKNKGKQNGAAVVPTVGKDKDRKYSVKAA